MAAARNKDYIIEQVDKAINELVYPKFKLLKAYNYYNGHRDSELFRYLEENFGIGNPTSVEFTPLIKKHVDALLGEYLDVPTIAKVSCKDEETLSNINRDKLLEIKRQLFGLYKRDLNKQILDFINGKDLKDPAIDLQINKLIEDIDNNFISEYEIAALNVINYVLLSRVTNLDNLKRLLLLDLLIAGCAFYRTKPSAEGTNLVIECLNPLNTFIDRNPESPYVKDGYRAVIRKWKTRELILAEYGDLMTRDAISELDNMHNHYEDGNFMYVLAHNNSILHAPMEGDLDNGKKVVPGFPIDGYETYMYKLIPVFEVEWIDVDKEGGLYIQNRYEGIRIGNSIYIPLGKSKTVIRTHDAPRHCKLSVGGIYMMNRDNLPTSLVLQCCTLLD